MSPTEASTRIPPADPFIHRATQLLKEYTAKLNALVNEGSGLQVNEGEIYLADEARFARLKDHFRYLVPPCEELIRQVSGLVEQGKLESLDRVELWLTLTEFEHELSHGKKIFGLVQSDPVPPLKKTPKG